MEGESGIRIVLRRCRSGGCTRFVPNPANYDVPGEDSPSPALTRLCTSHSQSLCFGVGHPDGGVVDPAVLRSVPCAEWASVNGHDYETLAKQAELHGQTCVRLCGTCRLAGRRRLNAEEPEPAEETYCCPSRTCHSRRAGRSTSLPFRRGE